MLMSGGSGIIKTEPETAAVSHEGAGVPGPLAFRAFIGQEYPGALKLHFIFPDLISEQRTIEKTNEKRRRQVFSFFVTRPLPEYLELLKENYHGFI